MAVIHAILSEEVWYEHRQHPETGGSDGGFGKRLLYRQGREQVFPDHRGDIGCDAGPSVYVRSCDVRESIKSLYDYHCQVCGNVILKTGWEASQERKESWKYLSADLHHIHPLSKGGPDIKANAVCLCPTCHRKFHSGEFRLKQDGNKIACIDEMLGHKQFIKLKHQIDLGL